MLGKLKSEYEKTNIIINLHSELGLDVKEGKSHPKLSDLIVKATGKLPDEKVVSDTTKLFVGILLNTTMVNSSSFSQAFLLGLEQVAYDILNVLKEILKKSGNPNLMEHSYIVIHEQIEAMHIDNTEDNLAHVSNYEEAVSGYKFVMSPMDYFLGFYLFKISRA